MSYVIVGLFGSLLLWPWRRFYVELQRSNYGPVPEIDEAVNLGVVALSNASSRVLEIGFFVYLASVFAASFVIVFCGRCILGMKFSIRQFLGFVASIALLFALMYSIVRESKRERDLLIELKKSHSVRGVFLCSYPLTGVKRIDDFIVFNCARLFEVECDGRDLPQISAFTKVKILRVRSCNRILELQHIASLKELAAVDLSYLEVAGVDKPFALTTADIAPRQAISLPPSVQIIDAHGSNLPLSMIEPPLELLYVNISDRELTPTDEEWGRTLPGVVVVNWGVD